MMTVGDTTIKGVLTDILHVLGITKNLFYVNKTTSLNHVFEFNNIVVVRNNQRKVIGEGVNDNKLYKLCCNTKLSTTKNVHHITISQETNSINLWHQRLKHINANNLKVLSKKKLIEGPSINNKAFFIFLQKLCAR
jgi:histidyl-tRNA synthetase